MLKKVMFSSKKSFVNYAVFLFIMLFVLSVSVFKVSAAANNIIDVGVQWLYVTALDSNGDVWSWGRSYEGALGAGGITESVKPVKLKNLDKIKQISQFQNDEKVIGLREDGTVWTWGGGYGTPIQVKGLSGIKEISSGGDFYLALKEDGTVWSWGNNEFGQLGNGVKDISYDEKDPEPVKNISAVKHISAGQRHSLALKEDGTVWAWGDDDSGQLGDNDRSLSSEKLLPIQVKNLSDIEQIASAEYHSIAVKKDGTVWTWGSNASGQLGRPYDQNEERVPKCVDGIDDAVQVAAGRYHSLVLKRDGTVYGFGSSESGNLGVIKGVLGDPGDNYKLVKLNLSDISSIKGVNDNSIAIDKNNRVFILGFNANGLINIDDLTQYKIFKADRVPKVKKIVEFGNLISTVSDSQIILGEDGTVWSYGDNEYGELGSVNKEVSRKPKQISIDNVKDIYSGGYHNVFALKNDGTVWFWGYRDEMSGLAESTEKKILVPTKIEDIDNVKELIVFGGKVLAIKNDGTLWAWGSDVGEFFGQVSKDPQFYDSSMSRLKPVQITSVDNVKKVKILGYHTSQIVFILSNNGRVWSVDFNDGGHKIEERKELKGAKNIVSSEGFLNDEEAFVVLKEDGTLMSFGSNKFGQLGDGTFEDKVQPVAVKGITDVKSVSCAPYSIYAVKNDGSLWTWGANLQNYEGSKVNLPTEIEEIQDVKEVFVDNQGGSGIYAIRNNGELWNWFKTTPKQVQGLPSVKNLAFMQVERTDGPYYPMIACDNGEYWSLINGELTKIPLGNVIGFTGNIVKTKASDYVVSVSLYTAFISSQAIIDTPTILNVDIPSSDTSNNGGSDTQIDESSYIKFKEIKDVNEDKDFTIRFTSEVSEGTINNKNIFVVDENNHKVDVKLEVNSLNKKEVFIKHINNYERGKSYKIFISDSVKSDKNKNIKKGKLITFNVV